MSTLDDTITASLNDRDREAFARTEELGWFALGLSQFTGKLGWVTWVVMATQVTMFVIGAWCAVQFFAAQDVLMALKWGLPSAVLILGALAMKLSLMPQIQAARILREIKRVELMLASRG